MPANQKRIVSQGKQFTYSVYYVSVFIRMQINAIYLLLRVLSHYILCLLSPPVFLRNTRLWNFCQKRIGREFWYVSYIQLSYYTEAMTVILRHFGITLSWAVLNPPSLALITLEAISHNLKGIMAMQLCLSITLVQAEIAQTFMVLLWWSPDFPSTTSRSKCWFYQYLVYD